MTEKLVVWMEADHGEQRRPNFYLSLVINGRKTTPADPNCTNFCDAINSSNSFTAVVSSTWTIHHRFATLYTPAGHSDDYEDWEPFGRDAASHSSFVLDVPDDSCTFTESSWCGRSSVQWRGRSMVKVDTDVAGKLAWFGYNAEGTLCWMRSNTYPVSPVSLPFSVIKSIRIATTRRFCQRVLVEHCWHRLIRSHTQSPCSL